MLPKHYHKVVLNYLVKNVTKTNIIWQYCSIFSASYLPINSTATPVPPKEKHDPATTVFHFIFPFIKLEEHGFALARRSN